MSGIAGLHRFSGREVYREEVRQMIGAMPHRSSDREGVWVRGSTGLAQGLVFTTPESQRETLPLVSPTGLAIIADARIDNRAELQRALRQRTTPLLPDAELILAAYEAWGEECVDHLIGDFAFAIWDSGERKLFCARDHFGMRPLYYYQAGDTFAFGTEIKAILALPEVPRRLDEVCVGNYLANIRDDIDHTIYEGILRLPNAHVLVADISGVRTRSYYTLRAADIRAPQSDAEYAERFRELFEEAVRCRVRSAYPVGAHLSGGLDSSSVACVARDIVTEEGRGPLHTFSVVFRESLESDERGYIDAVLTQGGMTPHYIQGDDLGPLSNLGDLYGFFDEHLVGGTQHLAWALTRKAGDVGVRIVLDGLDGDSTVSHGELYLRELARRGDWTEFRRQSERLADRYRSASHRQTFQEEISSVPFLFNGFGLPELRARAERGSWRQFFRQLSAAHQQIPFDRWGYARSMWKELVVPFAVIEAKRRFRVAQARPVIPFVDPAFAERTGLNDRYREQVESPPHTTVRENQRLGLAARRRVTSLETSNHVAAAFGMEAAHPFYDKRLIEYCLALPPEQSLQDGWTRLILRRAMEGVLPAQIAWRVGKAVMAPNFQRGLFGMDMERLKEWLTDLGPLAPYVNVKETHRALAEGPSMPERQQVRLASIATLSYWIKRRFDSDDHSHQGPLTPTPR